MRLISVFLLVGLAAFVAASIAVAIAARRDRMSEPVRWLSVLAVGAIGVVLAIVLRILTSGLSDRDDWIKLVAVLAGFAWPAWRFVKIIRMAKR